jgi:hypothetical protein
MSRGSVLAALLLTASNNDCLGVGRENDITIGADGLPLISYEDGSNSTVRVARCEDAACIRATSQLLDGAGLGDTSIAVGPDGRALVTYAGRGLRVAHCRDASCSAATMTVLDELPGAACTSVAFGADGRALISYRNETNGDLKVAHCDDPACMRAIVTTLVADACCVGRNSAIAVGADGRGVIAYHDDRRGLSVAHCEDRACRSASISVLPDRDRQALTEGRIGLAVGVDGLPLIAYEAFNGMRVAHCEDAACRAVDSLATVSYGSGFQGGDASIAIGRDGLPLIAYHGSGVTGLLVAHCDDLRCQRATVSQHAGGSTYFVSAAIGADGLGIISFWQTGDPVLKVAHCLDLACARSTLATVDAGGNRERGVP